VKNSVRGTKLKTQYPKNGPMNLRSYGSMIRSRALRSAFIFPMFSCLILGIIALSVMAEVPPLPVSNAEGKEIATLKVWEKGETEFVLLGEVRELFSGRRKLYKALIGQETTVIRGREIVLTIARPQLKVDGEEYILSNPPARISDEMAVPVEFLTEILPNVTGRKIILDRESWVLQLTSEPFVKGDGLETDSHVLPDPDQDKFRVIIDPGHGGYDSGAKSRAGLLEKELTLRIAKRMKELLAQQESVEAYLTRSRDDYLTPVQRVNSANKLRGNVYLSIHFNWSPSQRSRGFRTYVNSSQVQSGRNSGNENNTMPEIDVAVGNLLESERILLQSKQLAKDIKNSLESIGLTGEQDREVSLAFMDNLSMPGILVEVLHLSSPQDLSILSRPGFVDSVSQALIESILTFRSVMEDDGNSGTTRKSSI